GPLCAGTGGASPRLGWRRRRRGQGYKPNRDRRARRAAAAGGELLSASGPAPATCRQCPAALGPPHGDGAGIGGPSGGAPGAAGARATGGGGGGYPAPVGAGNGGGSGVTNATAAPQAPQAHQTPLAGRGPGRLDYYQLPDPLRDGDPSTGSGQALLLYDPDSL